MKFLTFQFQGHLLQMREGYWNGKEWIAAGVAEDVHPPVQEPIHSAAPEPLHTESQGYWSGKEFVPALAPETHDVVSAPVSFDHFLNAATPHSELNVHPVVQEPVHTESQGYWSGKEFITAPAMHVEDPVVSEIPVSMDHSLLEVHPVSPLSAFETAHHFDSNQMHDLENILSANPHLGIGNIGALVNQRPSDWQHILSNASSAVDLAREMELDSSHLQMIQQMAFNHPDLDINHLREMALSDLSEFKEHLEIIDISDRYHFSDIQTQQLEAVIHASPEMNPQDFEKHITQHPETWSASLNQLHNAVKISELYHLSAEDSSVLKSYLMNDLLTPAADIQKMIELKDGSFERMIHQVHEAQDFSHAQGFSEEQQNHLVQYMAHHSNFTIADAEQYIQSHGSMWDISLRQENGIEQLSHFFKLNSSDRNFIASVLRGSSEVTPEALAGIIYNSPESWHDKVEILQLQLDRHFTATDSQNLAICLAEYPNWNSQVVRNLVEENRDWKAILEREVDNIAVTHIAAHHQLSGAEVESLRLLFWASDQVTEQGLENYISNNSTTWKSVLNDVAAAKSAAADLRLDSELTLATVKYVLTHPGYSSAQIKQTIGEAADGAAGFFRAIHNAEFVATALGLSSQDQALLEFKMVHDSSLSSERMIEYIKEHSADWQSLIKTEIHDYQLAHSSWNPTGAQNAIAWTYGMSFEAYSQMVKSDSRYWVDTSVQVAVDGKYGPQMEQVIEKRPMSDRAIFTGYLEQYGSPFDKSVGRTSNLFLTEVQTGDKFSGFGSYSVVVDAHATSFDERVYALNKQPFGVDYRNLTQDQLRHVDTTTYLARQLSDQMKAMGGSWNVPAGDKAIDLAVRLENVGVTDVSKLFVKDGHIVDISSGKDFGIYEDNRVFDATALGDGWTNFRMHKLENGQVYFTPQWEDSSDVGALKMVVAIAGFAFGIPPVWMTAVNAAIDVASGKSLGDVALGAFASYVGGAVGGQVSGFVGDVIGSSISSSLGSIISSAVGQGASAVTSSIITGQTDNLGSVFLTGAASGAVSSAVSMGVNAFAGSIGLDLQIPKPALDAASSFISGKFLGQTTDVALAGAVAAYSSSSRTLASANVIETQTDDDGNRTLHYANGESQLIRPDGSTSRYAADGHVIMTGNMTADSSGKVSFAPTWTEPGLFDSVLNMVTGNAGANQVPLSVADAYQDYSRRSDVINSSESPSSSDLAATPESLHRAEKDLAAAEQRLAQVHVAELTAQGASAEVMAAAQKNLEVSSHRVAEFEAYDRATQSHHILLDVHSELQNAATEFGSNSPQYSEALSRYKVAELAYERDAKVLEDIRHPSAESGSTVTPTATKDEFILGSDGKPVSGQFANGNTLKIEDGLRIVSSPTGEFISSETLDGKIKSVQTNNGLIIMQDGQITLQSGEGQYHLDPKTGVPISGILYNGNTLVQENGVPVVKNSEGQILQTLAGSSAVPTVPVNPLLVGLSSGLVEATLNREISRPAPLVTAAEQLDSAATKKAVLNTFVDFQRLSGDQRVERIADYQAQAAQQYQAAILMGQLVAGKSTELEVLRKEIESSSQNLGTDHPDVVIRRERVENLSNEIKALENGQKVVLANYSISQFVLDKTVKLDDSLDKVAQAGTQSSAYAMARAEGLLQFNWGGKQLSTLAESDVLQKTAKAEAAVNARTDLDERSKLNIVFQLRQEALRDSYATYNQGLGASLSAQSVSQLQNDLKNEVVATQQRAIDKYTGILGESAKSLVGLMALTDRIQSGQSQEIKMANGQVLTAAVDKTGKGVGVVDAKGNLIASFTRDASYIRVESAVEGSSERVANERVGGVWKSVGKTAEEIKMWADAEKRAAAHNATLSESNSTRLPTELGGVNDPRAVTAQDIIDGDRRMGRVGDIGIDIGKAVLTTGDALVGAVNVVATLTELAIKGQAKIQDSLLGTTTASSLVVGETARMINSVIQFDESKKILSEGYSRDRKIENAAVDSAIKAAVAGKGDLWDVAIAGGKALVDNKAVALGSMIESVPYMLGGAGAARAVATRAMAMGGEALVASSRGAIGAANLMTSSSMIAGTQFNETLNSGASGETALATAGLVASVSLVVGGVSHKFGATDEAVKIATAGMSVTEVAGAAGVKSLSANVNAAVVAGIKTLGGLAYQGLEEGLEEGLENIAKAFGTTGNVSVTDLREAAAAAGSGAVVGLAQDAGARGYRSIVNSTIESSAEMGGKQIQNQIGNFPGLDAATSMALAPDLSVNLTQQTGALNSSIESASLTSSTQSSLSTFSEALRDSFSNPASVSVVVPVPQNLTDFGVNSAQQVSMTTNADYGSFAESVAPVSSQNAVPQLVTLQSLAPQSVISQVVSLPTAANHVAPSLDVVNHRGTELNPAKIEPVFAEVTHIQTSSTRQDPGFGFENNFEVGKENGRNGTDPSLDHGSSPSAQVSSSIESSELVEASSHPIDAMLASSELSSINVLAVKASSYASMSSSTTPFQVKTSLVEIGNGNLMGVSEVVANPANLPIAVNSSEASAISQRTQNTAAQIMANFQLSSASASFEGVEKMAQALPLLAGQVMQDLAFAPNGVGRSGALSAAQSYLQAEFEKFQGRLASGTDLGQHPQLAEVAKQFQAAQDSLSIAKSYTPAAWELVKASMSHTIRRANQDPQFMPAVSNVSTSISSLNPVAMGTASASGDVSSTWAVAQNGGLSGDSDRQTIVEGLLAGARGQVRKDLTNKGTANLSMGVRRVVKGVAETSPKITENFGAAQVNSRMERAQPLDPLSQDLSSIIPELDEINAELGSQESRKLPHSIESKAEYDGSNDRVAPLTATQNIENAQTKIDRAFALDRLHDVRVSDGVPSGIEFAFAQLTAGTVQRMTELSSQGNFQAAQDLKNSVLEFLFKQRQGQTDVMPSHKAELERSALSFTDVAIQMSLLQQRLRLNLIERAISAIDPQALSSREDLFQPAAVVTSEQEAEQLQKMTQEIAQKSLIESETYKLSSMIGEDLQDSFEADIAKLQKSLVDLKAAVLQAAGLSGSSPYLALTNSVSLSAQAMANSVNSLLHSLGATAENTKEFLATARSEINHVLESFVDSEKLKILKSQVARALQGDTESVPTQTKNTSVSEAERVQGLLSAQSQQVVIDSPTAKIISALASDSAETHRDHLILMGYLKDLVIEGAISSRVTIEMARHLVRKYLSHLETISDQIDLRDPMSPLAVAAQIELRNFWAQLNLNQDLNPQEITEVFKVYWKQSQQSIIEILDARWNQNINLQSLVIEDVSLQNNQNPRAQNLWQNLAQALAITMGNGIAELPEDSSPKLNLVDAEMFGDAVVEMPSENSFYASSLGDPQVRVELQKMVKTGEAQVTGPRTDNGPFSFQVMTGNDSSIVFSQDPVSGEWSQSSLVNGETIPQISPITLDKNQTQDLSLHPPVIQNPDGTIELGQIIPLPDMSGKVVASLENPQIPQTGLSSVKDSLPGQNSSDTSPSGVRSSVVAMRPIEPKNGPVDYLNPDDGMLPPALRAADNGRQTSLAQIINDYGVMRFAQEFSRLSIGDSDESARRRPASLSELSPKDKSEVESLKKSLEHFVKAQRRFEKVKAQHDNYKGGNDLVKKTLAEAQSQELDGFIQARNEFVMLKNNLQEKHSDDQGLWAAIAALLAGVILVGAGAPLLDKATAIHQIIECRNPKDIDAPPISFSLQAGGDQPVKEFLDAGYSLVVRSEDRDSNGLYRKVLITDGIGQSVEFDIFEGTLFDVVGVEYSEGKVIQKVVSSAMDANRKGISKQQVVECFNPQDLSVPPILIHLQEGGLQPAKEFQQAGYSIVVKAQDVDDEGLYQKIHIKDGFGNLVSFQIHDGTIFDVAGVEYSEGRIAEKVVSPTAVSQALPFAEKQYMDSSELAVSSAMNSEGISTSNLSEAPVVRNAITDDSPELSEATLIVKKAFPNPAKKSS